jgi:uncharacterized RDD family membrane protein YckC
MAIDHRGGPMGHAYADLDQVMTGEAVALELPPASLGLHLLSGLLDVALAVVVLVIGSFVTALLAPDAAIAAVMSVLLVSFTLVVAPAVLEALTLGRTIGKLALGLRTVRDDAGPISFHHSFVRQLVGVVEIWVFLGVPALVSAMVSARGKRLGDYAAGTYVVRDRFPLKLPWPAAMPPHLAPWAAAADIAPLPDSLTLAVRQLLGRAGTLDPPARQALVGQLVAQVSACVSPPPPPGTSAEDFLAAVAAERRSRDARRLAREADLRRRLTQRHHRS